MRLIYHLARAAEWRAAQASGVYDGSAEDRADGFLHFSTAAQIEESAARHRAGEADLVLLQVDGAAAGDALKWEASRGGALFPHLYGSLPVAMVHRAEPLPLDDSGRHVFPLLEG
ncbi:MAG: DUF952 domain-containing protein [Alphaproteobacteria bacterium]